MMEKFTGKEENVIYRSDNRKSWKFEKGKMRISISIFIYTIHFAFLKMYTKFHNPKASSCWENFDEKWPYALYLSDRRKHSKFEKAKWALASLFSFTQYAKHT